MEQPGANGTHPEGEDQPNTPQTAEEQVESLTTDLEQLKDTLQRVQADFINYRRRADEKLQDYAKFANSRLLVKLLPVLDEFNLALIHAPANDTSDAWLEGFRLIHRKLQAFIESEGVMAIAAQEKNFDPAEHEALAQQESADHKEGQVVTVVREGYKLNGRVLRPAQVTVAKRSDAPAESTKENNDNSLQGED